MAFLQLLCMEERFHSLCNSPTAPRLTQAMYQGCKCKLALVTCDLCKSGLLIVKKNAKHM